MKKYFFFNFGKLQLYLIKRRIRSDGNNQNKLNMEKKMDEITIISRSKVEDTNLEELYH